MSTSSIQNNGGTDSMTYHTGRAAGTDGQTQVQYRHIENPWGNIWEWIDGANFNARKSYVCTNPANYADDTTTNYTDAVDMYARYKKNLLGVISDVGLIVKSGDRSEDEKSDAGIDICKMIKAETPWMPIIMQSSQVNYRSVAESLGVGFIAKTSKTLLSELQDVILREFGFGEFVFRDLHTGAVVGAPVISCRCRS